MTRIVLRLLTAGVAGSVCACALPRTAGPDAPATDLPPPPTTLTAARSPAEPPGKVVPAGAVSPWPAADRAPGAGVVPAGGAQPGLPPIPSPGAPGQPPPGPATPGQPGTLPPPGLLPTPRPQPEDKDGKDGQPPKGGQPKDPKAPDINFQRLVDRTPLPPTPPAAPPVAGSKVAAAPAPLALGEVLAAVDRSYPLLQVAFAERGVVDGRVLASLGVFDTNLQYGSQNIPEGSYENYRTNFGVNQRFLGSGAGVFAGYRTGLGDFPVYNLGQKTADGGEFRAGVSVPLLRDRVIDRARAAVRVATIDRTAVEPAIDTQRLLFLRTAARVYWVWVAAGRQLQLAQDLLRIAQVRDDQLRKRAVGGIDAPFNVVDNLRSVAERNFLLVQAERAFQRAQVELSLFLRDEAGEPLLAGLDRVPPDFPTAREVDPAKFPAALARAIEVRPELARLRLQREGLEVQRQLARNQMLPGLNLNLAGTGDVGNSKPSFGRFELDRYNLSVDLVGDVPWQRRAALGELRQVEARLQQLAFQERMQVDNIRAEVQDAFARLERAYHLRVEARRRVDLTRLVADQERARFGLGTSDILRVTLRELDVFQAEVTEVGAALDYAQAEADFEAAVGGLLGPRK